ncbi:UPF0262 family protein [Paracoccus marinus]|uniref:UPF0262 family protein n=1 Tax=Paracoccus marinus TaxID=288426 RepID=UPI00103D5EBA|nr:UPF0262 family protein [Paracoccus marinus]GLS79725.1 UPF0262 protein [Paracoccus marinus]
MTRLIRIDLDDSALPTATIEMEQERRVAIFDLLEDNSFTLPGREGVAARPGPYALSLAVRDRRLVFDIATQGGDPVAEFHLAMGPFRQAVKDYSQICSSYFEAVRKLPTAQIEAIDMARRGIHNEGARTLMERLDGKANIDIDTARRLFTLVCALIPD